MNLQDKSNQSQPGDLEATPASPDVAPPAEKKAPKAWAPIFTAQRVFYNDLDCISEMTSVLLPILKSKDKERQKRIDELELSAEVTKEDSLKFKSQFHAKEFIKHLRKFRRADTMFRQSVITSIVSKFDEYFSSVLKVAYLQNPNWLKNPDKKISHKDLFEITSLDEYKNTLITKEIDALMRDSHFKQVEFVDSHLKIGISERFPRWGEFNEITERRNLFTHNGGLVNEIYLENAKKYGFKIDPKIEQDTSLSASDRYITAAIDCFYEISVRITQGVVRRLFPESYDAADTSLINESVDLLTEERWQLAEDMFKFALDIPEKLLSSPETKLYFVINLCIALKFAKKEYSSVLHSLKWNHLHPKWVFAVAVLDDDFELAERLMRNQSVQEKIPVDHLRQWPLLREFRKTDRFRVAYKELYGKDFEEELLNDVKREIESDDGNQVESKTSSNS